jgi:multiple sugar transport system permease protein
MATSTVRAPDTRRGEPPPRDRSLTARMRRMGGGRRKRFGRDRRRVALLMLAPATIHLVWWIGVPVAATFVLAFMNYDILAGTATFDGLDNFRAIFSDSTWNSSIWHTVVFTFFTVPVAMAIAVVLAVLLNNKVRGRAWYRAAVFMPHITATVAIALVWMWMFEPRIGIFNTVLGWFGVKGPVWLGDPSWALFAVIMVSIWKGVGIKMLIYLAALQAMPQDVYEAAALDGASKARTFWSITLPLLKPATFFVLVVSIIDSFQAFDQLYVLTPDGGPANSTTVMTYEIYSKAFKEFQMGQACAMSVVLFAFLLILMLISRRLTGREEDVR